MALFGQDTPDPRVVAGGAALGDLIAGGPGRRAEGEYVDQYRKNATAAEAMWQARDSRARAIARELIRPELVQRALANDPAALGELGAAALGTADSPNFSNITGGARDVANMEIDRQRRQALDQGNVPRYNYLTQMVERKPYQPNVVTNGVILPDGVPLGDEAFTMVPLPQTLATIEQREAAAARTRANVGNDAEKTQAQVEKARRPPAPRTSTPKPPSAAQQEAEVLAKARAAIAAGASVEAVRKRMKDRGYGKLAGKL